MPNKQRLFRLLRKFVWWLGLFVFVNVAFYVVIPLVAANYIKRHLETQGYTDVQVELGYPGPRGTYMPFLKLQKDLEDEHLSLIVRDLEITYVLTELLRGHLRNIAIERISLELNPLPSIQQEEGSNSPKQKSAPPPSPKPGRDKEDPGAGPRPDNPLENSLVGMARLLPVLPFESFSLGKVSVYRASATGPFRRMEMSGSIENRDGILKGVMTFRGEKITPYSLLVSVKPSGDIAVVLRSNELLSAPLLMVDSRIESSMQTGIAIRGSMNADLKQLTPFMALFMPLGSDLHKVNGSLHVNWEGATSYDVTVQTLFQDPKTTLTGAFQLDLHLPAWAGVAEDISVKVKGRARALPQEIKVSIAAPTRMQAQVHSEALSLPSEIQEFLVDADDMLTVEAKDHFTATLSFDDDIYTWAVEGFLQAQYGDETSPLGARMTLVRASGDGGSLSETEAQIHTWGRLYYLPRQQAEVEKVKWNIKGDITSTNQHVDLNFAPDSFLAAEDIQTGRVHIPKFIARLNQPWRIVYDSGTKTWEADLLSLPLGLPKLQWGDTTATIQKTILHISRFRGGPQEWEMNGTVIAAGLVTQWQSLILPSTHGGIGFWIKPTEITLGMRLETADKFIRAQARLNHDFETKRGNVFAVLAPQPFSMSGNRLSRVVRPWPYPFDVTSGEISAKASVVWEEDNSPAHEGFQVTRGELSMTAGHIGGSYHEVVFQDANATLTLMGTGLDNVAMPVPAAVTVGSVNHGIQVSNLSFAVQLGFDGTTFIPTFDLKDFSARVFEGQVTSPRIYLNMTSPPNVFVLKLEGLRLDKILQLEQQRDLEGTGALKGFVPITLHDGEVEIKDGKVEAEPPGGLIRFRPLEETVKKLSRSNFNMDVVLRALTNFHYDVLEVGVNYAPDGALKLRARLEGENPDLQRGQPIHFNMNIEENVPALLKSLRVVKDIEQQADQLGRIPM